MEIETDTKTDFDMKLSSVIQIVHHNSAEIILSDSLSSPKHEIETEVDPLATDSEEFAPDPIKTLASSSSETEEQEERKRAKKAKVKTPDSGRSSSFSFIDNLPLQNFDGEKKRNKNLNKNNEHEKNSSCFEAASSQRSVKDAGLRSLSPSFTCFECLQNFLSKPALKFHIDKSHSKRDIIYDRSLIGNISKPSSKGKSKTSQNSEANSFPNSAPRFECRANGCNEVFFSPHGLEQHTKSHKLGPGVYFTCSICPETFASNHLLKRHMFLHENVTRFKCSSCSLYLESGIKLRNHLHSAIHTRGREPNRREEEDDRKDKRDSLKIPASSNNSKSLTSHPFKRIHALKMHGGVGKRSHKKNFKCSVDSCGKVFYREYDLKRHYQNVHVTIDPSTYLSLSASILEIERKYSPKNKNFECMECNTFYKYALGLQVHLEEYHSVGPKPKAGEKMESEIFKRKESEHKIKQEIIASGSEMKSESGLEIKSEVSNFNLDFGKSQGEENCGFMEENAVIQLEEVKVSPDLDFFLS